MWNHHIPHTDALSLASNLQQSKDCLLTRQILCWQSHWATSSLPLNFIYRIFILNNPKLHLFTDTAYCVEHILKIHGRKRHWHFISNEYRYTKHQKFLKKVKIGLHNSYVNLDQLGCFSVYLIDYSIYKETCVNGEWQHLTEHSKPKFPINHRFIPLNKWNHTWFI